MIDIKLFILSKLYYKITNINRITNKHSSKALLSYSILHFRKGSKLYIHPNSIESKILVEVLTSLGYSVDVVNNVYSGSMNYNKYELIIGEGYPIYNYFNTCLNKQCKVIYYSSGSHPFFQTQESVKRLVEFKRKMGCNPLSSLRIVPLQWGIAASLADKCIIIGNNTTKKTFESMRCKNAVTIEPPFFSCNIVRTKYSAVRRKKYLWFGSYGYLHKGLDLVLDLFFRRNDIELFVCGYSDREKEFLSAYGTRIADAPNIHDLGFVDIRSDEFKNILSQCGSVILVSASEGCSTALLTVIGNGGLIPIASRSCGIDIDDFGFVVENDSSESLEDAINSYLETDDDRLNEMSELGFEYVNKNYKEENFKNKLLRYISDK